MPAYEIGHVLNCSITYKFQMEHFYGGGMGYFMWAFWLIPVVIIFFAMRFFQEQSGRSNQTDSPLEILKRRYARGEINKEEFERLKNDLRDA